LKKSIFWGLGLILLIVTVIVFPIKTGASSVEIEKETMKEIGTPHVLIQYNSIPKVCTRTTNDQVNHFGWGGWKLQSGITDYRVNFNTLPVGVSRQMAEASIDLSFSNLQGAGGGILFHNAGETSVANPADDGQNAIFWRNLPASYVAVTYIWTDGHGRLKDADTIFNRRYSWAYTGYNGQNDCNGKKGAFDLRDIATHEFGHWMGLGDLYDSGSKDLTMYGYASRSELKKDTLGLGDITGVRAVWP
jgi:hypothetical protein